MVILGVVAQFAIMPPRGFLIAKFFHFSPHFTLALVLGYGAGIVYRFDEKRYRALYFQV